MNIRNEILVVLLAMTLTSQGLAQDDEQQNTDNKRKFIVAGAITVGVVATAFFGPKVWKHFDLGKVFKKKVVDGQEYIGIDLGTSKSGGGRGDELIADTEGRTMTASAVLFAKDGKAVKVGDEVLGEEGRVTSAKRIIGTSFNRAKEDDTLKVVADSKAGNEHMAAIETAEGHNVSPEKVAEEVLRGVKQRIDNHYGNDFKKAVITVPAYFYEFQKAATKRAAKAAGFDHVVLINEPTAAAFAHGAAELDTKKLKEGVNYLVYDFGGGTMDVSIVSVKLEKKQRTFTVTSVAGNPRLGGDDIDKKIATKFAHDLDLDLETMTDKAKRVLHQKAEEAKVHLSDVTQPLYKSEGFELQGKNVQLELSIDDFNEEIHDIVAKTTRLTEQAIDEAPGINVEDIHEVVLVGGSSRNLKVRAELIDIFGEAKLEKSLNGEIDPDEMVAKGAAKYAKVLDESSDDYHLSDVVPISLRVDMLKNKTLVSEEVIAKLSATPAEGTMEGSALGSKVQISIRQGESTKPDDNVLLGTIDMKDTKAGNEIEITYEIDTDGILNVTAEDTVTGELKKLPIDMSKTPVDEVADDMLEEGAEQGARGPNNLTPEQLEQVQQNFQKFFGEGKLSEKNLAKLGDTLQNLSNKTIKAIKAQDEKLQEIFEVVKAIEEKMPEMITAEKFLELFSEALENLNKSN